MTSLWLVVGISAVSLELALLSRDRRLAAANVIEASAARAAAEGGLETPRARLTHLLVEPGNRRDRRTFGDPAASVDPWLDPAGIIADTLTLGEIDGSHANVELHDLGARLHLNRASPTELQRFLAALPMDAAEADRLAQRITDWRDADELAQPNGAERETYRRAGARVVPRNGEFRSVRELGDVLGVTPRLLERIEPMLTIDGSGQININAAPRPVLLALPGLGDEVVDLAGRARRSNRRIASMQMLSEALSHPARRALERETATLLPRLSFETREVMARSVGWATGSPVRIAAHGVFVRGGSGAFLTARRIEWAAR